MEKIIKYYEVKRYRTQLLDNKEVYESKDKEGYKKILQETTEQLNNLFNQVYYDLDFNK